MFIKNFVCKISTFLFLLFCVFSSEKIVAQSVKQQITVFAPIYIDEAFDGNTYKIWENKLPKDILPGLEFYNGVMLAIDSLKKSDKAGNLNIKIYDYKSRGNSINEIIKKDSIGLLNSKAIIASLNNRSDVKILADYAKQKNIPLISATYPNDGGVSNNSNFILLNSTLLTHCKAIYNYFKKSSGIKTNIVFLTRNGSFEDMVNGYFKDLDADKSLNFIPVNLADTFYTNQLIKLLDTTKQNLIFCGSVNENFAQKVASTIAAQKKYKAIMVGMPTWETVKSFDKNECKGIEFIYTSSYNYSKTNNLVALLTKAYSDKFFAKPSDLVFKGYEIMLRIGKAVSQYGANAFQLFSDDMFKSINSLDIQPNYNKTNSSEIDYYENKKIYFIKRVDGIIKSVE